MAWTALMTFTANSVLTAAQLNTYIGSGGNLSHTAPAVVTTQGDTVYATGANTITRLAIGATGSVYSSSGTVPRWLPSSATLSAGSSTTASTSYADLAAGSGPSISLTTGTSALVGVSGHMENSGTNRCYMSFEVSGATTQAAADSRAFGFKSPTAADPNVSCFISLQVALTAGTNTFTVKYRVTAGTGTFQDRRIFVMPL